MALRLIVHLLMNPIHRPGETFIDVLAVLMIGHGVHEEFDNEAAQHT